MRSLYAHVDVQPPGPLAAWHWPPFSGLLAEGRVHGRGASDNKGPLVAVLAALESYLTTSGLLPVNVRVWFDGEEESGNPHLAGLPARHSDRLRCDGLVVCDDTRLAAPDRATLVTGLRGSADLRLAVRGPARALHSGLFGGEVLDPALVLARLLTSLWSDGRVAVPGFYRRVRSAPPGLRTTLAAGRPPFRDLARMAAVPSAWLIGEPGWQPGERSTRRPSLTISELTTGPGRTASADCTGRGGADQPALVPGQLPREVAALVGQQILAAEPGRSAKPDKRPRGRRSDRDTAWPPARIGYPAGADRHVARAARAYTQRLNLPPPGPAPPVGRPGRDAGPLGAGTTGCTPPMNRSPWRTCIAAPRRSAGSWRRRLGDNSPRRLGATDPGRRCALSCRARRRLPRSWDTEARLEAYLARAQAAGIDLTVVFPVFNSDYAAANDRLARIVGRQPDRLIGFASIDPARDVRRTEQMIGRAVEVLGFRGIKVHGRDSLPGRAVCEAARRWGLPILVDVVRRPAIVEMLAGQYPDVNLIVPHLGGFADDWAVFRQVIDQIIRLPNVYADTSGVRYFDAATEAVRPAGPGKVIFGSDGPQLHPGVELRKVELLGLPPWAQALVTGGTILRLLGPGATVTKTPTRVMPSRGRR